MSSPVNSTDLSWGTLVQLIKCKSVNKPQVAIVSPTSVAIAVGC